MATKKDLVEAYSFSRRRLVTAFVSGAPGGREVEPNRPGRTIVGGLALALLIVAGGAVLGVLKSPSTVEWDREALISDKDTGATYLLLRGSDEETELRPLQNITSAMLVLGSDLELEEVRGDEFERDRGAPIGILGAPASPPEASSLIQDGWTACTGAGGGSGIKIDLAEQSSVELTPDTSFVVRTPEGAVHLIAQSAVGAERGERAYVYPVPGGPMRDAILQAVAGTGAGPAAVEVPDSFITLFPQGRALELATFGLTRADLTTPWVDADRVPEAAAAKAEVGDLLVVGGDTTYLLTTDGTLKLDPFSLAVYRQLPRPAKDPLKEIDVEQSPPGALPNFADVQGASWPTDTTTLPAPRQLCAQLDVPGGQPGVLLGTTADGSQASAEDIALSGVDVRVDPGHGAFVWAGDWLDDDSSAPVLVDDRGYQNPVGPGEEQVNLGYGDVDRVVVPQQWITLLRRGVPLTIDAARCPPASDDPGPTSCS
ncbi:type VII secretion protein EccB [Nocardioides dongxiaopingii]|uniref:type VII secretion protein EccB n=1 Tax=Nocardioides dongxiaopingii TaxID=2576036 RepID=UPI0014857D3E|nr:type VII secretion protein EccB [Nocardioides dongxiaopingii]